MYVTVHIGAWVFPALFTLIMLGWAWGCDIADRRRRVRNYGHGMPGPHLDLGGLLRWTFAALVVLCAWVVWLAPLGVWGGVAFAAIVCLTAVGIWWGR